MLTRLFRRHHTARYLHIHTPPTLGLAYLKPKMSAERSRPSPDLEEMQLTKKPRIESEVHSIPSNNAVVYQFGIAGETSNSQTKKPLTKKQIRKHNKKGHALPLPYSSEDVLWRDVIETLGQENVDQAINDGTEWDAPFAKVKPEEVEATVIGISSSGRCSCLSLFYSYSD